MTLEQRWGKKIDMPLTTQELTNQIGEIKESLTVISRQVQTLTILLTGNGHPEDGLIVKVDRIREAQKSRKAFEAKLIGVLLTVGALVAADIISRLIAAHVH
jgi:hypothetical protein